MADGNTFELYSLMVEEAREMRTARRDLSNYFLTLNLAGVGALGFLAQNGSKPHLDPALLLWCAVALVFVCLIWRASNAYYTHIITAQFEVINALENKLGQTPLQDQWKFLVQKRGLRFFTLERAMPVLFVIGYIIFLFYQISWQDLVSTANHAWAPISQLIESRHH